MVTIDQGSNRGAPKWNGDTGATQAASPRPDKSTRPSAAASSVPATRPRSTPMFCTKPRP